MALLFWQLGSTAAQTATPDFFYDAQGNPYAVKYNGTLYYYITNLQGDVLHIVDTSGNTVVSYTYSPYGKPLTTTGTLASTLGAANPLRYRGYYFDSETVYYYLQSRYYDPEIGRFLNADSYASTGQGILGCNMFAYCNNNPVNFADSSGREPIMISVSIVVLGVVVLSFLVELGAQTIYSLLQWISTQWQYAQASISFIYEEEADEVEETLPRQGLVEGDPDAPPVNAGKQGKHVEGHNNHVEGKSTWPDGQTGVQQTQEAWQNGVPDPKKPDGSVRIGIASDGTVVRVHIGSDGAIHGYPYYP